MIKALETDTAGRPVAVVLGLSFTNLDRLSAGDPIGFHASVLGLRPDVEVWIMGGHSCAAMRAELAGVGLLLPDDAGDDAGGILSFTATRRVGVSAHPLAVIGISDPAAAALRAGQIIEGRPYPGLPVLRLLAGPNTDELTDRVSAGRVPAQVLDLRGGRTD